MFLFCFFFPRFGSESYTIFIFHNYPILCGVGLNPLIPQQWAGLRILPPISLPQPRGAPLIARIAASPPEEPPDILVLSCGLTVAPVTGLEVS